MNKKILFVCPFPYDVQAGQRLKYEQHFKLFEKNNYEITISSFIDNDTYKILYKKGFLIKKIYSLIKGYFKRIFLIRKLNKFDIVYIFMWVTPYFGNSFEKIYINKSNKSIFDMEDNVLMRTSNNLNIISNFIKNSKKINYLIKNSDHIITSTPALGKKVEEINKKKNWTYISPTIDINRFIKINKYIDDNLITIGWTGTFSSMKYLEIIKPVIIKISKIRKIKFLIISNSFYEIKDVNCEFIYWTKKNEITDLSKIDIGVYPLPLEDEWVIGKSGLKSLQYMAMGIASVSSEVGNIRDIIENSQDGVLVRTLDDWYNKLLLLIDNKDIRTEIGNNAKLKIKNNFSIEAINNKYLNIFNNL